MAFTFSHAVLAPYLHKITAQRLPLAALTIGCMLPDITRVIFPSPMAHHFSGMFSINLLTGALLCIAWYKIYRPVLFAYCSYQSPTPLSKLDLPLFFYYSLLALLIGNFSHLFWDSFTHLDDRTWFGHSFLSQSVILFEIQMQWHQWLQYGTSLVVLPWLYIGFRSYLITLDREDHQPSHFSKKQGQYHFLIASLIATIVGISRFIFLNQEDQFTLYSDLVQGFKYFCMVFFCYLSLVCLYRFKDLQR